MSASSALLEPAPFFRSDWGLGSALLFHERSEKLERAPESCERFALFFALHLVSTLKNLSKTVNFYAFKNYFLFVGRRVTGVHSFYLERRQ